MLLIVCLAVALWAAAMEWAGRRARTPSLVTAGGRVFHPLVFLYRVKWLAAMMAAGLVLGLVAAGIGL